MLKTVLPLIVFCFLELVAGGSLSAQCVPVKSKGIQACMESSATFTKTLKQFRSADTGTPEKLFYDYFEAPDLNTYKALFLPADWYDLPAEKFTAWKNFLKSIRISALGQFVFNINSTSLCVIKYSYILDDEEIYETFMAKKSSSGWRPVSAAEEQQYMNLANLVKYTHTAYLHQLNLQVRSGEATTPNSTDQGKINVDKLIAEKLPLKVSDLEEYHQRYNDDSRYITKDKFNEDRLHDASFVLFLDSMNIRASAQDTILKLIYAQDYLNAAAVADHFSEATYTYAPFVDKIREIYGRDRIRKWDHVNHKWD